MDTRRCGRRCSTSGSGAPGSAARTCARCAPRSPGPSRGPTLRRGRSLDVLRRMRLGHRDLVKLDLLEGRLREVGCGERERLDALADELAPIVSRYVSNSPTRALVVVAGDHGFAFGAHDDPHTAH